MSGAPEGWHRREDCRVCGERAPEVFLALGPMPLANALLPDPSAFADEPSYPLDVAFCPRCTLVQTPDVVDPERLFAHYLYVSGTSETMAAHHRAYAEALVGELGLGAGDRVVEVASNDGSLLARFRERGVPVLGVEPARNVAALAEEAGIPTRRRFFDRETGRALREEEGPAAAVLANNVLAHVDDPVGFLAGMRALLRPGGVAVVEVPSLAELVDRLEYDTIYHEHLSYFSVSALAHAFARAELALVRVDEVPVHGGSLRLRGVRAEEASGHAPDVRRRIEKEEAQGLASAARYRRFAADVHAHRDALRAWLDACRAEGRRLAAYGAPAKGNTLLNWCGVDASQIPFTVDRSPLKVGRFTPGAHLPVRPVEALAEARPDDVLILAWNFAAEVVRQQDALVREGTRFWVPVPEPRRAA
ncbi:MAG: class I SAM-dependent methyltransferase [Myxococcota bacterium]|nr:class I SAM-dependent methyltransferase [Myxococcota bacterium]